MRILSFSLLPPVVLSLLVKNQVVEPNHPGRYGRTVVRGEGAGTSSRAEFIRSSALVAGFVAAGPGEAGAAYFADDVGSWKRRPSSKDLSRDFVELEKTYSLRYVIAEQSFFSTAIHLKTH